MDVEAQLATYVCFKDDAVNNIVEHIRLCKPGWEVEHISDLLDWRCCARVQSARTASMTGWHCGLVSHIRQVTLDILSMHWIIHRGSVGFQTHEPRTGRCLVLMSLTSLNHSLPTQDCSTSCAMKQAATTIICCCIWMKLALEGGKALQRLFQLRAGALLFIPEYPHPLAG